jgi:hypothetical protein
MLAAARRLEEILNYVPAKLLQLTEAQASLKPAPGKWSKKEILGHLIDSASNNHQRFVRLQLETNLSLPNYEQDSWVSLQQYQQQNWVDLVKFWMIYNKHLLTMLKHMDESKLGHAAFMDGKPVTLQFYADDYLRHMEHHLRAIIQEGL